MKATADASGHKQRPQHL